MGFRHGHRITLLCADRIVIRASYVVFGQSAFLSWRPKWLANGGTLGIRAPLRDTETPVVRPYFLVHDIVEAVAAAAQSGAEIAMQPTEIPGRGKFAILIQGGIESGLWQV